MADMHSPRPGDPIRYRWGWTMHIRCRNADCRRELQGAVSILAAGMDPGDNMFELWRRLTCSACGTNFPTVVRMWR